MRTPSNETRSDLTNGKRTGPADAGPVRTCILSREGHPRDGLIRLALSPDGEVLPDVRAKAPGRGAWIGVTRAELAASGKQLRGALARAFKTGDIRIPDDLGDRIATQLERALLDRLGLEGKAGNIVIGAERIETAARSGKIHLLIHAADAGTDGSRKLDQALRVGNDREGSGDTGFTIPVSRTILSLALGRENVVHVGLTDVRAARRVSETLARWLHFIGPDPVPKPCETNAQGASDARGVDVANGPTNEERAG